MILTTKFNAGLKLAQLHGKLIQIRRFLATSAPNDASKIRNMALVAHIDSGKTTLTESILLSSSYLSNPGTVDTGSTTTDFLPAERERGITIQSASIPVKWQEWQFNLIDTPGHADFGMEVESASRVIDGAVVLIDSVEGVEAQTKGVWRQLDRYKVPSRMVFLNKLDRPGASFKSSILSVLAHQLHRNPTVLTLPVASFNPQNYANAEPGIQGLVDLIKWELWKWNDKGEASRQHLPTTLNELQNVGVFSEGHPILGHLVSARVAVLENLSMHSEELMDHLLELSGPSSYLTVKPSAILPHLRAATLKNNILPVFCGAAARHIGTEIVMDYVGELLASPNDAKISANDASLQVLAWKVGWDKTKGWMTFVRVYSGTLTRQSTLFNTTRNQREKVSKLLLLYASEAKEVDELPFGSVGVIVGLKFTRTGDTLISAHGNTALRSSNSQMAKIIPPPTVISASVVPHSHSDLDSVQNALQSLIRTDPSVRVEIQEGQILLHGLGALHLEIVEGRLRDEWQVKFEFGKRRVSYRESLGSNSTTIDSQMWSTEMGGKTVIAELSLSLRPMELDEEGDPNWDGNVVVDDQGQALPLGEATSNTPLGYVAQGISTALSNSPHTSLAFSRVHIQINALKFPPESPSVLIGASASILRRLVKEAGPGPVMEPYVQLKVSVGEDSLGKVVKDLTEHGGEVHQLKSKSGLGPDGEDAFGGYSTEGLYIPPSWLSPSAMSLNDSFISRVNCVVQAVAPLSKMLDYSNRLRALSGGHGLFEMTNAGFRPVDDGRRLEILKEIGRA